jgi:hypothetical protein
MLDGYVEDDIEIGEKNVVSVDRIKEVTMRKINRTGARIARSGKRYFVLIAAVVVLAAAFAVTGYALGWFGLKNAVYTLETPDAGSPAGSPAAARSYLSLSGWAGTPEFEATAEWSSFLSEYADRSDPSVSFDEQFRTRRPIVKKPIITTAATTRPCWIRSWIYAAGTDWRCIRRGPPFPRRKSSMRSRAPALFSGRRE